MYLVLVFLSTHMNYITSHKRIILILATVALILFVIFLRPSNGSGSISDAPVYIPTVELYSLNATQSSEGLFNTTGEIVSESRVSMRAEVSEVIRSVFVDIGDTVYRGQTLMQLNSSALQAQRKQLEASVAAERASLDSILSGTRDEQIAVYIAQKNQAQTAVKNAESSLNDKVQDAFTKTDDIVHSQLDIFFDDPLGTQPSLVFTSNDSDAARYLESERVIIEQMFERWKTFTGSSNLAPEQIQLAGKSVETDLQYLRTYTGVLGNVVNALTPSSENSATTIASWKSTVTIIRNSVNGAITSLVAARDALSQAESSLVVAENQLLLAEAGATNEQVLVGEARLASAEAALESLLVTLSKTTISSPISGTITEVAVEEGNLVSPGQILVSIVNTNNLSVTAYVGPNDLDIISLGAPVRVENVAGTVVRIAPGVNRETQKIEISIQFDANENVPFVDGQFVNVSILSNTGVREIPLNAVASTGDTTYVYSVTSEGIVTSYTVELGAILGEKVELVNGATDLEYIISSTRGIEVGQQVKVAK